MTYGIDNYSDSEAENASGFREQKFLTQTSWAEEVNYIIFLIIKKKKKSLHF